MKRPIGFLSIDPGVTTGLAWGVFDLGAESVGEALLNGSKTGFAEATGSEQWQVSSIVGMWEELEAYCKSEGIPCEIIIEDFILRPGRASADRAQLAPVRITAMLEGLLLGREVGLVAGLGAEAFREITGTAMPPIVKQQVSAAKGFATRERLERWGCWKVAMRHSRDAWRHIALRIATLSRDV